MDCWDSSSSDETVNGDPIDSAKKKKTVYPCLACNRLLSDSLADKTGSRTFTGVDALRAILTQLEATSVTYNGDRRSPRICGLRPM
jgi:hypothetical protein